MAEQEQKIGIGSLLKGIGEVIGKGVGAVSGKEAEFIKDMVPDVSKDESFLNFAAQINHWKYKKLKFSNKTKYLLIFGDTEKEKYHMNKMPIRKNIKTVSVFLPVILLDLATLITNFLILLSRILYSGLNVLIITQFTIGIWNNMNG